MRDTVTAVFGSEAGLFIGTTGGICAKICGEKRGVACPRSVAEGSGDEGGVMGNVGAGGGIRFVVIGIFTVVGITDEGGTGAVTGA